MSTVSYTNSEVTVSQKFKASLDAENFNQQFRWVLKHGITKKDDPLFTIESDTTVTVGNFTALSLNLQVPVVDSVLQETVSKDILTTLNITQDKEITGIDYTAPYIVLDFMYDQTTLDSEGRGAVVPSLKNVAYSDIIPNQHLVLGKCLYRDNSGTKNELYSVEETRALQKSALYEMENWFAEFTAVPTAGLVVKYNGGWLQGTKVEPLFITYVASGADTSQYAYDIDNNVIVDPVTYRDLVAYWTTEADLPAANYHRYDMICVDDEFNWDVTTGSVSLDATEDEYPKPTKPSFGDQTFPVTYTYLAGWMNGATRAIEPTDLENIIPRFMRIPIDPDLATTDIIISSQADCDLYFGNSDLDDEGGMTPGKTALDGFRCDYSTSTSVKSVYMDGRRVQFYTKFDGSGNPVPYLIYNRVVVTSGSEIITPSNCFLKYSNNTFAGFVTQNSSSLEAVNIISDSTYSEIQIKADNLYNKDLSDKNVGDPLSVESGNEIFCFSDDVRIPQKYTLADGVNSPAKRIELSSDYLSESIDMEDESNVDIVSEGKFASVKYTTTENGVVTNYVIMVYVLSGVSDTVGYSIYKYNPSTKAFDWAHADDDGVIATAEGLATITNLQIKSSGTRFHVFFDCSAGPYHTYEIITNITNPNGSGVPQYGGVFHADNPVKIDAVGGTDTRISGDVDSSNNVYTVYVNTNDQIEYSPSASVPVATGTPYSWTTAIVFDGTPLPDTDVSAEYIQILRDSINIITYYDSNADEFYALHNSGATWYKTLLDSGDETGQFHKVIKNDSVEVGAYTYLCAATASSDGSDTDQLKLIRFNIDTDTLTPDSALIVEAAGAKFRKVDIILNDLNEFPNQSDDSLVQIVMNDDPHNATYTTCALNVNAQLTQDYFEHNLYKKSASDIGSDVAFAYWTNDRAFFIGTISAKYAFMNYEYQIALRVEDLRPALLSPTDIFVSLDFVENAKLNLNLDTSVAGGHDKVIDISNSVNSEYNLVVRNFTDSDYGVYCNGFTYGNNIKYKDINCTGIETVFSGIKYSTLSNIVARVSENGTPKVFDTCANINVIGVVDGSSVIGNGNFED
jgi:hypothetical protein